MAINWTLVIIFIIDLIAEGMSKDKAVEKAAKKFGISVSDIWKRGGF